MNNTITPEELEIKLGEDIKALRLQKNITRKNLCKQAEISESASNIDQPTASAPP